MAEMTTYIVEVLDDEELLKPPCPSLVPRQMYLHPSKGAINHRWPTSKKIHAHSNVTKYLESISPIPAFAWEKVWPWKLMHMILEEIATSSTWEGLRSNTPSIKSGSAAPVQDPSSFSFSMASNLPFSSAEQIKLLESHCIASRLCSILNYIQHENDRLIQCSACGSPISTMKHLFTVPGAEGTTGAYVNEHGYIHQTMTLREVSDMSVVSIGRPETKDSWFPGYSWTMTHCSRCFGHLGWKFLPVDGYENDVSFADDSASELRRRRRRTGTRGVDGTNIDEYASESSTQPVLISRVGSGVVDGSIVESENDIDIDRNQQEASRPRQINSILPYFWGLTGSSVSVSRSRSNEEHYDGEAGDDNGGDDEEDGEAAAIRYVLMTIARNSGNAEDAVSIVRL